MKCSLLSNSLFTLIHKESKNHLVPLTYFNNNNNFLALEVFISILPKTDFSHRYRFIANIKKRKTNNYKGNGIKEPCVRAHKTRLWGTRKNNFFF